MQLTALKNTLAYQLHGRPYHAKLKFYDQSAKLIGQAAHEYLKSTVPADPVREAGSIYLHNHAVARIMKVRHPNEPLPTDELKVLEAYNALGAQITARMLYYVTIISIRENRHCLNKSDMQDQIAPLYGSDVASFIFSVDDNASTAMQHFLKHVPNGVKYGPMIEALEYSFRKGKWHGGFGGKKWAEVIAAACKYARGEISGELFVDIGWALAHNGGPIFNKGMFFNHPSNSDLYKVLDVQRAGLMPGFVLQYGLPTGDSLELTKLADWICSRFDDPKTVDWDAVKAAGAVGGYSVPNGTSGTPKKSPKPPTPTIPKATFETPSSLTSGDVLAQVEFWPGMNVAAITREAAKKLLAEADQAVKVGT